MLTLVYLHYSPWSEKAAWALDHHRVVHARKAYVPMLGEPWLRMRVKKLSGPVTVPVLFGGHDLWEDSLAIARYAEVVGSGSSLFPGGTITLDPRVLEFERLAEELMSSGRARAAERAAQREDVLVESLPPMLRGSGPLAPQIGKLGVKFLRRKYQTGERTHQEHLERMRRVLDRLRAVLSGRTLAGAGGHDAEGAEAVGDAAAKELSAERPGHTSASPLALPHAYMLGSFSYADIACCAALQFVKPVADAYIPLGNASREVWTDPDLTDYPDLLAWRDRVYDAHRRLRI